METAFGVYDEKIAMEIIMKVSNRSIFFHSTWVNLFGILYYKSYPWKGIDILPLFVDVCTMQDAVKGAVSRLGREGNFLFGDYVCS